MHPIHIKSKIFDVMTTMMSSDPVYPSKLKFTGTLIFGQKPLLNWWSKCWCYYYTIYIYAIVSWSQYNAFSWNKREIMNPSWNWRWVCVHKNRPINIWIIYLEICVVLLWFLPTLSCTFYTLSSSVGHIILGCGRKLKETTRKWRFSWCWKGPTVGPHLWWRSCHHPSILDKCTYGMFTSSKVHQYLKFMVIFERKKARVKQKLEACSVAQCLSTQKYYTLSVNKYSYQKRKKERIIVWLKSRLDFK